MPGSTLTVRCTLELVADHEYDAFDLPHVRTDWHVAGIERPPQPDGTEPDYLVDLAPITS